MSNEPRYPVTIHIGQPRPIERRTHSGTCPSCGKRTRFITLLFEWYGQETICLRCKPQEKTE